MKKFFILPSFLPSFGIRSLKIKEVCMMVMLLSTAIPLLSQCPYNKVVGSGVGISTLSQALSSGVLTLNNAGEVIGDFCVNGTFDIVGRDFRGVNLVVLSGSILTSTTPSPDGVGKWFYNSSITGQNLAEINFIGSGAVYGFGFSSISGFSRIFLSNQGGAFIGGSTVTDNTLIELDNVGVLWNGNSTFSNSPIDAKNGSLIASTNGCTYTTNCISNITNCYAISVRSGSSYWGWDNTFSNSFAGVYCGGCSIFEELNSDFINCKNGIWLSKSSPEHNIRNNIFSGSGPQNPGRGIYLFESDNIYISENIFNHSDPASSAINDQFGANNQFSNNTSSNSASFLWGDNAVISDNLEIGRTFISQYFGANITNNNFINDLAYNLKAEDCSNIFCFYNSFNQENENVVLLSGRGNTFRCNTFNSPNIGLKIPTDFLSISGHEDLDIFDNQFNGCAVGMDIDVEIPQQLDKGNDFFANGLGLDYSGPYTPGIPIFRVRNTPTELPAHNPNGAMSSVDAQTPVGECNVYPQSNDPNTNNKCTGSDLAYKKKLIKALLSCYKPGQPISGKCHGYIKKALEMIKKCPNLLQDIQIKFMYDNVKDLDVSKLPNFYDVRKNIRVHKNKVGFTPTWTLQPSLKDINELIAVNNQKIALDAVTTSIKNQKIADERSVFGEVSITNLTAANYKMALEWYLDYKAGLIPSIQRKAAIVALAEDCLEFGSPGQEVAHYMCGLLELVYNTPSECSETRSKTGKISNLKITPNPSSNFITIENVGVDQILIFDLVGNQINNWSIVGENVIDISNLSNGIYFIKTTEGGASHKFIKI